MHSLSTEAEGRPVPPEALGIAPGLYTLACLGIARKATRQNSGNDRVLSNRPSERAGDITDCAVQEIVR